MPRATKLELEHAAVADLLEALASFGIVAKRTSHTRLGNQRADAILEVDGQRVLVEAKSVVTPWTAEDLGRRWRRAPVAARVVVADRIAGEAQEQLRANGWGFYDRRGHLRFVLPPVVIDAPLSSRRRQEPLPRGPLTSQVSIEVAISCLLDPSRAHGVRDTAAFVSRAPSAVSKALAGLRDAGLVTSRGEPVIPDLFRELAAIWGRSPVPLADVPRPGRRRDTDQLGLGFADVETTPGWALTDTLAAASWGMPVVAPGDYPPDFYVPTPSTLQRARSLLGDAGRSEERACTVAVAPVRLVCYRRHDHATTSGAIWPVANHIVVALDLSRDPARGAEILDAWQPDGISRVW